MDPTVWGPLMWDVAFEVARHGGEAQAAQLFGAMLSFLPCGYCRDSYRRYCGLLEGQSGLSAVEWLWTVRDMVNQKLGKPALSIEQLNLRAAVSPHPVAPVAVFDLLLLLFGAAGGASARPDALPELCGAVPLLRLAIHPPALREHLPDPPPGADAGTEAWLQRVVDGRNSLLRALGAAQEELGTLADAHAAIAAARAPVALHEKKRSRRFRR